MTVETRRTKKGLFVGKSVVFSCVAWKRREPLPPAQAWIGGDLGGLAAAEFVV